MVHEVIHFAQYCQSQRANLFVSQRGNLPATPDGLTLPSRNWADTDTGCPVVRVVTEMEPVS
jgi:hypothetical protein